MLLIFLHFFLTRYNTLDISRRSQIKVSVSGSIDEALEAIFLVLVAAYGDEGFDDGAQVFDD